MQVTFLALLLLTTYVSAVTLSPSDVVPIQAFINTVGSATLIITNSGSSAVTLSSVPSFTGDTTFFSVSGPQNPSIAAGSSATYTFKYTPGGFVGVKRAAASLSFSDGTTASVLVRGLSNNGIGGNTEPSLQYILDTFALPYNVGDDDNSTALYHSQRAVWSQFPRGGEILVPSFQVADPTKPVVARPIATFGPTDNANSPTVFLGICQTDSDTNCQDLYSISRQDNNTINPTPQGSTTVPTTYPSFSFYSRWPVFASRGQNGRVFQQDKFNTFAQALPHHVRVWKYVTTTGVNVPYTYLLTWEEYTDVVDFQDIIVVLSNVRAPGEAAPTTSSTTTSSTSSTSTSSTRSASSSSSNGGPSTTQQQQQPIADPTSNRPQAGSASIQSFVGALLFAAVMVCMM